MDIITYKKAGVDIEKGDRFVDLIAPMVKKTFRPEVMTDLGFFNALFKLDIKKYKEPILVSSTDGVGTKLKIAFMADKHDTIGIDLVAMSVNDILTSGAEPLFFLDYFASGKLSPEKAAKVVSGIAEGCKMSNCALIGGETAEMPGFYDEGEYDLAGFAVGIIDKNKIIDGSSIKEGDAVVGLASSGIHSNGYSLVRKVLFDVKKMGVDTYIKELGATLGEELLKPTIIYTKAIDSIKEKITIKGMAHITGGGITGNLPRIFRGDLSAVLKAGSWDVPAIFDIIRNMGNVPADDMEKTFNMGLGYIMVVPADQAEKAVFLLKEAGYNSYNIGSIERGAGKVRYV